MNLIMQDTKHQYKPRIKRNQFTASNKIKRLIVTVLAVIAGIFLAVLCTITLLEQGYVQAAHETRDEFGHTHTQQATAKLPIELASPINQGE